MRAYHCSHRVELVVTPICYSWPDGTPLEPPVRKVSCPSCKKQWAVGLTREQHTRLLRMRTPGDRSSPYELAPLLLSEMP